ncbi:MAG: class I SAM-dependent methyltransferase [Thermoguttaceae bacterium]
MRKRYLHDEYGQNDVFWDRNWDGDWQGKCEAAPRIWSDLVAYIMNYLKPGMLLLEGGCGDGRYVRHFGALGVNVIGVDFAQNTVHKLNAFMPELDVRVGDVRCLEFPDNYFDAYYSGGVIEHFEDGVEPQLTEAHRVLKNGGFFFVTVPHMNVVRRCASAAFPFRTKRDLDGRNSCHQDRLREFRVDKPPKGFHFHEYVFPTSEMRQFLIKCDFSIIEERCLCASSGLQDIELYRFLMGADRQSRTFVNRAYGMAWRGIRSLENRRSRFGRTLSNGLGAVIGNLKLYICRTKK